MHTMGHKVIMLHLWNIVRIYFRGAKMSKELHSGIKLGALLSGKGRGGEGWKGKGEAY